MITSDIERGRKLATLLHHAYWTSGIHGRKDMPEDLLPAGAKEGSPEHVLFLTLTVAIDYMREANALWQSSRDSFADPETAYLFAPEELNRRTWHQTRRDMDKHKLSKRMSKDCTTWRKVGITFLKKWGGDPKNFLKECDWDAVKILERLRTDKHKNHGRSVNDFPYLRGKKIGPLWIRMLRDNAKLPIRNMEAVPIPVDVHVARASLALGVVRGTSEAKLEQVYQPIRGAWRESVRGLTVEGREMTALDVDEPLWVLSKYGCTDRDPETGKCKHHANCPVRDFCVPGRVYVGEGRVVLAT